MPVQQAPSSGLSLTQPGARRLLHGHKTDRVPVAKSIRLFLDQDRILFATGTLSVLCPCSKRLAPGWVRLCLGFSRISFDLRPSPLLLFLRRKRELTSFLAGSIISAQRGESPGHIVFWFRRQVNSYSMQIALKRLVS